MTLINLIHRQIGLMPISYSFYKARGLYLLTFKGYKTGIASPSLRQLKEQHGNSMSREKMARKAGHKAYVA